MATFTHTWPGDNNDPWDSNVWRIENNPGLSYTIQNNTGRQQVASAFGESLAVLLSTDPDNIDLTVDLEMNGNWNYIVLGFRAGNWGAGFENEPGDGYFVEFRNGENQLLLRRANNGSKTTLGSDSRTISASVVYRVRILADGTSLKVAFDEASTFDPDVWEFEVTDNTYSSGEISLGLFSDFSGNWVQWNDLSVTDLDADPEPDPITADIDHGVSWSFGHKLNTTLGDEPEPDPIAVDISHGVTWDYGHNLNATLGDEPEPPPDPITVDIGHGVSWSYGHKLNATVGDEPEPEPDPITADISHGVTWNYSHKLNATLGIPPGITTDIDHGVTWTFNHSMSVSGPEPEPDPKPPPTLTEPGGGGSGASATLLDSDHNLVGFVDQFTSLSWRRSLWGAGSASLSLPRQSRWARQIRNGWVLIPPDEDDLAFIVRQLVLSIEGAAAGDLDVTAPGIGTVLDSPGRVVIPASGSHDQQNNEPAESAMKHYVDNHAGPGADTERQLPGFSVAADQARGDNVTYHARFEGVMEVISDIGRAGGLGWDITYDRANDEFVFDVIAGTDRTAEVFFDLEFESVLSLEWLRSQVGRSTLAYVGGDGEGATRTIETVWIADSEPIGFNRREVFLDQGSVDTAAALQEAGNAHLEAHRAEDTVEVEINPRGSFRYRRDFQLGDLVTVRNQEFDLISQARVVEVESTISPPSVIPDVVVSLGNPWPTVQLRIEEELKQQRSKPR